MVFYGGKIRGESAMVSETDIGSRVVHSYEVQCLNPPSHTLLPPPTPPDCPPTLSRRIHIAQFPNLSVTARLKLIQISYVVLIELRNSSVSIVYFAIMKKHSVKSVI